MVYASCKVSRLATMLVQNGMAEDRSQAAGGKVRLSYCDPPVCEVRPIDVQKSLGAFSVLQDRSALSMTMFQMSKVGSGEERFALVLMKYQLESTRTPAGQPRG